MISLCYWRDIIVLFIILCSVNLNLSAQLPTDTIFADQNAFRDSIIINRINPDLHIIQESDIDISIDDLFYDRASSIINSYVGNQHIGAPHLRKYWEPSEEVGYRIQPSRFDAYDYNENNIPYYETNIPFSVVNYSQGITQNMHSADAFFARKFNSVQFHFRFNRINDQGYLDHELNLNNNIYACVDIPSKKYNLRLLYISNAYNSQENGGTSELLNLNNPFIPNFNLETRLSSGNARRQEKIFMLEDSWKMKKFNSNEVLLLHQFVFKNLYSKYSNPNPDEDYFNLLQVDQRGYRIYNEINTVSNKLGLQLQNKISESLNYTTNIGLQHKLHFIQEYNSDQKQNWLALDAQLYLKLRKSLHLILEANQSIVPELGDTKINSSIHSTYKDYLSLQAHVKYTRRRPSILNNRLIASNRIIYTNDLKNESAIQAGGGLGIPRLGIKSEVSYSILNNYIYYNNNRQVQQVSDVIQGLQLKVEWKKQIRFLEFQAEGAFQKFNSEFVYVPTLYLNGLSAARFPLFKKRLNVTTGPYFKIQDEQIQAYYEPIISDYIYSPTQFATSKYSINYLLAFRIESFNFYAHIENIEQIWTQPYAELAFKSEAFVKWRVGIKWKLLN